MKLNGNKVLVLDGGFSSQISCHVGTNADGDPLWSAKFLKTNAEDVYRTHLDYLHAGADVITTNTYQASVGGFVKHLGVSTEEATELIRLAVKLARRACDTYLEENSQPLSNPSPLVAGSVGPYGAHLNDGSEYRGNYADIVSSETIREWHIPRINALLEAGVDLLAIETIPCLKEAQVLVELLKEYPKAKAWLSFSCSDDKRLAHGEDFEMAAVQCWQANPTQLIAVGVNCCPPNIVSNLVKSINKSREQPIPFVTYPNSGEKYIPDMGWTDKDKSESIDKFVHEWLKLGVQYIGGCCRTYQDDISQIRKLKVFGISLRKRERDDEVKILSNENAELKNINLKLNIEMMRLKKTISELQQEKFSDYVTLMKERDGRYSLYHQKLQLEEQVRQLTRSPASDREEEDPLLLRLALRCCREQLAAAQRELARLADECADTVPRRDYDALEARERLLRRDLGQTAKEYRALENCYNRAQAQKKSLQEEVEEIKERCRELERAGTPRPQWELCADFIGGGRERWRQLARGLSSRDVLVVLLRELGPAADSEHLEYFDGLGTDPAVPPYLRYSGRVRNRRLSRRELSVVIGDVWRSKERHARHAPLQDYLARYFEDRYPQAAERAELAYGVCAAAQRAQDEPQVRVFWGALRGRLAEDVYWAHRDQCLALRAALLRRARDDDTITLEDFEKVAKATFPLKNEVDIKNLSDAVRKQLKMKINHNLINLDKLFFENEEGFDRLEFARELFRQRQQAQEKYVRELATELAAALSPDRKVGVQSLKRAFAVLDPAIDHVRMERNIRWAFSDQTSPLDSLGPRPLRAVLARLANGHIERVGPRPPHHPRHPRPRPHPRHKLTLPR